MILINAQDISLSFTDKKLLENLSFSIVSGDKIGIVGINGTGKSTLLKILANLVQVDSGKLTKAQNLTVSYLSQNPTFDENSTALDYVTSGFDKHKFPKEHEARTVLNKLGVTEHDKKISQMSGGQRRRIAIAKALIFPCELLILDEPTNHIDSEAVVYLEQYLKKYKGAIVMVTHDRYFLDRISNKIFEIDKGDLFVYDENYEGFLSRKAEREQLLVASERKKQSLLKTELEWLKQGPKARGTKSRSRIESIEKLKENTAPIQDEKVQITSISSRLGKQIIEIENVSKAYDNVTYIDNFSYNLLRKDRIGIVGQNGAGKSTLLKIIMGEVAPDSGSVTVGKTVKIGYFSQENDAMDESLLVIDYIKDFGEFVETTEGKITASKLLEKFLFPAHLQYTQISRLSGGEKRRLFLLSVLITAPNILFFDEPTNDLDITTLGILEDYLTNFDGAVVTVSHDRYFLDRTCEKLFVYEGNGKIRQRVGMFSDYLDEKAQIEAEKTNDTTSKKDKQPQRQKVKKLKFSFNEQREFDSIEEVIETLEDKLESLEKQIDENASDYSKLETLMVQREEAENELLEKMERFDYLMSLAQEIAQQNGK